MEDINQLPNNESAAAETESPKKQPSEGFNVQVDGAELIKMHVKESIESLKQEAVNQITESVLKEVEQKVNTRLKEKIELVKPEAPKDPYEEWCKKIYDMANKYNLNFSIKK